MLSTQPSPRGEQDLQERLARTARRLDQEVPGGPSDLESVYLPVLQVGNGPHDAAPSEFEISSPFFLVTWRGLDRA